MTTRRLKAAREQEAEYAALRESHTGLVAEAQGLREELRGAEDREADLEERVKAFAGRAASMAAVVRQREGRIAELSERVRELLAEVRAAEARPERVSVLLYRGRFHSVHATVDDAKAEAERCGAAADGWDPAGHDDGPAGAAWFIFGNHQVKSASTEPAEGAA
ncbi:hypothetical protein [Streptomyces cacaoi]|uniref:hypothetical protein n=1 Tax=Streptomyces cacaoi TaxID=1898 RepID=UPI00261324DE|nr:hypothetical protein [Streptomyces cacaoi]